MKKIFFSLAAALLISGTVLAQDKETQKACCKKDATAATACCKKEGTATAKTKACCMQPTKSASLRTAAAKPVKKETAVKPAPVKEG